MWEKLSEIMQSGLGGVVMLILPCLIVVVSCGSSSRE